MTKIYKNYNGKILKKMKKAKIKKLKVNRHFYYQNDKLIEIANKLIVFDKKNKKILDKSKFDNYLKKKFPNIIGDWSYARAITNGEIAAIAFDTSLTKAKKIDKAKRKKKNKYLKEYYLKNKEKMRLAQKKYYQKNKWKLQQQQLKYYAKNRKNILEKNSIYKIKNQEAIKKQKANYYQKHKAQIAFNYKEQKREKLLNLNVYKKEPFYKYQKYAKYR